MNPLEESNRRVQVSADASQYAYDYEKAYTKAIKAGKSEREAYPDPDRAYLHNRKTFISLKLTKT